MNPNYIISNPFCSSENRSVISEYLIDLNSECSIIAEKQLFVKY